MPLSVESVSRRDFLKASMILGAAALLPQNVLAAFPTPSSVKPDIESLALLSDTHVSGGFLFKMMGSRLSRAVQQVLSLPQRPEKVLVAGDCAHLSGRKGDYREYVRRIQPLVDAGMPLHMILGNHDHRERFWNALPHERPQTSIPQPRQAMVIPGRHANWFMLDSLNQSDPGEAELGRDQRTWLAHELDAHPDKPALIMLHHDPIRGGSKPGLNDSAELLAIANQHPHVKAIFFGHTHVWNVVQMRSGLYLVNLPALGYTLHGRSFIGWVECQLSDTGAALKVHALDENEPQHRRIIHLRWRAA